MSKRITGKLIEEKIKLKQEKKKLLVAIPIISLIMGSLFALAIFLWLTQGAYSVITCILIIGIAIILLGIDILCIKTCTKNLRIQRDLRNENIYLVKDVVIDKRQFQNKLLYFKNSIATPAIGRLSEYKTIKNDGFPVSDAVFKSANIGDKYYLVYAKTTNSFLCILPCKNYSSGGLTIFDASTKADRAESRPEGYTLSKEKVNKEKVTKDIILEHLEDVVHDSLLYDNEKKLRKKYRELIEQGEYEIIMDVVLDRIQGTPSNLDTDWAHTSLYIITKEYPKANKNGIMIFGLKRFLKFQIDDNVFIIRTKDKSKRIITVLSANEYYK